MNYKIILEKGVTIMTNKEKLKVAIEQDLNSESNYNEIIKKIEKGDIVKNKNNIWKYSLVPICLVVIIGIVLITNNNSSLKSSPPQNSESQVILEESNIILNINKVDNVRAYKSDLDIKMIQDGNYYMIPYFEELANLSLPSDFDNSQYFKIFGQSCYSAEKEDCYNAPYDKLINYQFFYENTKNDRDIVISFSKDNKPARDYHFSEEGSKKSSINGIDLTIYQYEEIYFTEFVYKNIYFDIETTNITEQELSNLLISIIK